MSAVSAAASLSLAGVASADTLEGSYTATVTGSLGTYLGAAAPVWNVSSCGPDCVKIDAQGAVLHPRGDGGWSGTYTVYAQDNGEAVVCTRSVTPALTASDLCPKPLGLAVNYQLTKNG
ncbi:hypothetical protein BST22_12875 [Mycolicibacterium chubuense]|nr:hypothetical protein BST22_12875 [Mycolicibacterium chubuense]